MHWHESMDLWTAIGRHFEWPCPHEMHFEVIFKVRYFPGTDVFGLSGWAPFGFHQQWPPKCQYVGFNVKTIELLDSDRTWMFESKNVDGNDSNWTRLNWVPLSKELVQYWARGTACPFGAFEHSVLLGFPAPNMQRRTVSIFLFAAHLFSHLQQFPKLALSLCMLELSPLQHCVSAGLLEVISRIRSDLSSVTSCLKWTSETQSAGETANSNRHGTKKKTILWMHLNRMLQWRMPLQTTSETDSETNPRELAKDCLHYAAFTQSNCMGPQAVKSHLRAFQVLLW